MTADNIEINPELPEEFDDTPNDERPESHQGWWFKPYLVTTRDGYTLRCLDGGAWDRSTNHGNYATLPEALLAARELTESYREYRTMKPSAAISLLWHKGMVVLGVDPDSKR